MSDPREGLWHTHQDCKDCDQNAERILALQYALDDAEARVKELEGAIAGVLTAWDDGFQVNADLNECNLEMQDALDALYEAYRRGEKK